MCVQKQQCQGHDGAEEQRGPTPHVLLCCDSLHVAVLFLPSRAFLFILFICSSSSTLQIRRFCLNRGLLMLMSIDGEASMGEASVGEWRGRGNAASSSSRWAL